MSSSCYASDEGLNPAAESSESPDGHFSVTCSINKKAIVERGIDLVALDFNYVRSRGVLLSRFLSLEIDRPEA